MTVARGVLGGVEIRETERERDRERGREGGRLEFDTYKSTLKRAAV